MTKRVVISHIAALLPDGEDAVARGERAIQAVMHGVRHVRGLGDDSATRVGSRITSRVEDPRIPAHVDSQLTRSSRYAVMAGLDLLTNAGLICAERGWELAEDERDCTGIIFASSFEHHEASLRSTRYAARRDELARGAQCILGHSRGRVHGSTLSRLVSKTKVVPTCAKSRFNSYWVPTSSWHRS